MIVVEILFLLVIVALQGYVTYKILVKINEFKFFFRLKNGFKLFSPEIPAKAKFSIATESDKLYTNSNHPYLFKMLQHINMYLVKNKGALTDFNLIRDIINRSIESKEEDINSSVPTPLYLGLAATMLGIIFGLIAMPLSNLDEVQNADMLIKPVIEGVKYAMIASVIGLILTTFLSIFVFRRAKRFLDEDKYDFVSFLEINLLPTMYRGEQSAIVGLNARLDSFGRELAPVITKLEQVVQNSSETVRQEVDLIKRIEELDIRKMTSDSTLIFEKLSSLMGSFEKFAGYYQSLNASLGNTVKLNQNIEQLISKTDQVDDIARKMGETVKMNNQLTEFLSSHFQEIANHQQALTSQVNQADAVLRNAIEKLALTVENEIEKMNQLVVEMQPKLEKAYQKSIEGLNSETQNNIRQISESFEKSREKFNHLDHLPGIVQNMERTLEVITELSRNDNNEVNETNVPYDKAKNDKSETRNKIEKDMEHVLKLLTYSTISGIGIYFLVKWIYSVFINLFVTF